MNRQVRRAMLLAFLAHAVLILTARYRLSYDAYAHMLFADHYQQAWWTLWEPRWYTGFSVSSYPPLVHQLLAVLSVPLGVDRAFGLLLWGVLTALPGGVYALARVFTGRSAAGYAALGTAVLPSMYLTAHTFGQLPTLVGLLFALLGLAGLARFLKEGGWLNGAVAAALLAAMMAAHHGTLLLLPWGAAAVSLHLVLQRQVHWKTALARLAIFGAAAGVLMLVVIWPFWVWGSSQTLQTPIDHLSRHNLFSDPYAPVIFFWPVYGPLVLLIPWVFWRLRSRRMAAPGALFILLFVLGLGGTTPLPSWLFGEGWAWLTYDRFSLWASVVLLIFLGEAIVLSRRYGPAALRFRLRRFRFGPSGKGARSRTLWRRRTALGFYVLPWVICILIAMFPVLLQTQPDQVEMAPVVRFLEQEGRAQWRYLSFGFGDQLALLSRLTEATTIDGSYHTARGLPELRSSGLAQIDTAYWMPGGMRALEPILQASGKYGVRWGFVNLPAYEPLLARHGWVFVERLSNGVQVWENPQAVLPPQAETTRADSPLMSFSWGVLPLSALALAGALGLARWDSSRAVGVFEGVYGLALGLLPVALCLWYYRPLAVGEHERVYFTYNSVLLYLSDGLALLALVAWGLSKLFAGRQASRRYRMGALGWLLAGIAGLVTLSSLWTLDRLTSLYLSVHLWLALALFLTIRERLAAGGTAIGRMVAWGCTAALVLQVFIGLWQFAGQSSGFLAPLGLEWPGEVVPGVRGVSVVQLLDGERFLRLYGSLPHPNILGGFLLFMLAGPALVFLASGRQRWWAALLFGMGSALLVLTFSRSAWLGYAAGAGLVVAHWRRFAPKRLAALAVSGAAGLVAASIPLWTLVYTRIAPLPVHTEQLSIQVRAWLMDQALVMIRNYPLQGVGAGAFVTALAGQAPGDFMAEPVHNLPVLLGAELGLPGGALLVLLMVFVFKSALAARSAESVVWSAVVIGLGSAALFDHYLWTMAAGRVLTALALGIWAGLAAAERAPGGRGAG